MRALHILPMLHPDLASGSDYHQFMLTRELVRLGVDVDVYTTWSGKVAARSFFGLGWPADYPTGASTLDGVRVHRFKVDVSVPPKLGHALSGLILTRWAREASRHPASLAADQMVDVYARDARTRPAFYDAVAMLGRGPHSRALWSAARRAVAGYDVVFAGFFPFATLWHATRLARLARKPLVLLPLFHPEDRSHHFRWLYDCCERADAVLAQTDYSVGLYRRLMPGASPVQVGPAVDPDEYTDAHSDGRRFRARYGLEDKRIVLCVGRKEHHKRYDLAVEAIERLADDRCVLVMIGGDVDRLPIASQRVRYLGPLARADVLDAYDACDVLVLPSEYESFGLVFLEAWMRRKPVIGNAACRPVGSVIAHGRDGYLAASAEEMAAQIRSLLDDPAAARALGEAGYAKVTGRYTWHHVATIVRGVYENVVQRPSPARERTG